MKDHRQRVVLATKYSNSAPGTDPNRASNHRKSMVEAVEDAADGFDYLDPAPKVEVPGASQSVYVSKPKEIAASIEETAAHAR
jgi:hypothetical protein